MNTHGGKRPGAGRKMMTPGEKRVQFSISVSPETRRKAADLRKAGIKIGLEIDKLIQDIHAQLLNDGKL